MTRRGQLAGRARSTLRAWAWLATHEPRLTAAAVLWLIVWLLAVALMTGPGW